MVACLSCSAGLKYPNTKFCSNKCQADHAYQIYIDKWKQGKATGSRGINAKNISKHIRRYLEDKYGEQCSVCLWNSHNPTTGKVPLEVDHIDGNADNNLESNSRLLCPNCHALTPAYRNLNRGNGKKCRREKYLRNDAALAQLVRASVL